MRLNVCHHRGTETQLSQCHDLPRIQPPLAPSWRKPPCTGRPLPHHYQRLSSWRTFCKELTHESRTEVGCVPALSGFLIFMAFHPTTVVDATSCIATWPRH